MARLPQPGSDNGTWGGILNEYLAQTHKSDGTLKDNIVTNSAIAPGAITSNEIANGTITEAQLSTDVQTKLNSAAGVTSVAGRQGDVLLAKSDVGLSNVDNTSDATKNSAAATLSNKTLDNSTIVTIRDANLTIQDDGNSTKQARFQASGISAGTTRQYSLPDASGTVALTSMLPPIRFSAPTAVLGVTPTDYAYAPRTLVGAHMRVASAPTGSDLIVDVQHWDGFAWTTIGTLTILTGSVTESVITFNTAQGVGNMIRLNVTSVGSTAAASGVAVDVLVG